MVDNLTTRTMNDLAIVYPTTFFVSDKIIKNQTVMHSMEENSFLNRKNVN